MKFQVDSSFFQHFKYVTALSSCLNYLGRKSAITLNFVPLYMFLFFSGCFWRFSLSLVLNNLIMMYLGCSFHHIFVLGFHWVSWICWFIILFKFGIFLAIMFVRYLFYTSLLTSISETSVTHILFYYYIYVRLLKLVPQLIDALFIFFFLFFHLGHAFQFTNLFFYGV